MDEAHRHVELALHAAGIGARQPVCRAPQAEAIEQLVDPVAQLRTANAADPALEPKVLAPGGVPVHGDPLSDAADGEAYALGVAGDIDARDAGGACVRPAEGGEDLDRGRFPGSIRPQQAEDGPCLDRERKPVECRHPAGIALHEADRLDRVAIMHLHVDLLISLDAKISA